MAGNVTSTNLLTINSSESLNAGAYNIVLTDSGTPFVNSGTFTASTSGFSYTSTGSVTTTGATYYTLTLGSGTYLMVADTTSTNAFTNGGTLTIASTKTLVASGDFDNNGVIAETGAIKHGVTSAKITNSAGTETASFNADGGYVYITVQDYDGNLNASAINTITGSVLTEGTLTDSEAITLTETGVDTGIFRSAALPFSVTNAEVRNNSVINVNGNGTLTLTFTDSKDSSDVGTDTATFIAASYAPASSFSGSYTPSTPAPVASPVVPAPVVTPAPSTDEPVANPAVETPTPTAESQPTAVTEDVAVSAKTYQFAKNLSAGFVGAEIRELQQILKDAGYFKYPSITNYFGSVTKAALMAYQNANGLSATGNLDSATRVALNGASVDSAPIASTPSSITFATNLAVGYVGAEVRELQQILKDAGFFKYPFITNYFGPVTKAALVAYQNANGLAASGVLDSATRSDLNGSTVPAVAVPVSASESHTFTTSMYVGATGAEVSALQQKLKDLGYFTYPTITDYYGPATREAVVKFQKDHNLQPFPGWVGPGTRAALNSL
ncbi:MAG: hypothetical protein A2538_04955 [Candidatus Magasanikbacteria bacterium RIFOXYD2_FULL_41_14]|uniref:Peptidoglycan binding-like domain-containing protein n=1 Tax=Candidatus Magasanikbacteria bacterium RIFOXYD2_FULL_41_14 TaxID=1798709 RepID=A0A1F6PFQ9_9BACT|nr:MAG: hypothetical protein A2538_04955 [Candidatus Magasanikbacteria bacterium RIFOXYD2_FULL_41_14]